VAETNSVSLGPNDRLVGQLHIEGDLRVSGTVEGELDATGNVEVGEGGKVKASIAGRAVTIGGEVQGPVTAGDKLTLSRSGSLTGDVRVARLVIQDGARFSGNVAMGKPAAAPQPVTEAMVAESAVIAEAATDPGGDKAKAKKR
jgi:cytoskeletal protein CcmA (bactofilin family)